MRPSESDFLSKIYEARSFHDIAIFLRRFIRGFSIIMALIDDCLKIGELKWIRSVAKAVEKIKKYLLDFSLVFVVACEVSGIAIRGVLS